MSKKWIFLMTVVALTYLAGPVRADGTGEIRKETYVFAIKGADTLALDKYDIPHPGDSLLKPVLLFAFGGGFKGGDRAADSYLPYFRFLAEHGYVVVSTDYRTGLKGVQPASLAGPADFAAALQRAVAMAVEDFFDATRYILENDRAWRIDPGSIVACGSSAGAVTSLQAIYELCNRTESARRLPESFRYAGGIAFAGAVVAQGEPVWKQKPCPLMLFHGDADPVVPFEKAVIDGAGLWGPEFLSGQLDGMQVPYYFYVAVDAGHEMAVRPLTDNRYDVMSFLTRLVASRGQLVICETVRIPGRPAVKKDFTVSDYIRNNMQ